MARRNQSFSDPSWAPDWLPQSEHLTLRAGSVAGPFSFLNPTTAVYDVREDNFSVNSNDVEKPVRARVEWNARDHRKGRHVLVLPRNSPLATQVRSTSSPRKVLQGIGRMFTMFPYWDVSWLVGVLFTVGCLIFVMCGLFYFLPLADPASKFEGEDFAGGLSSLIGATIFTVGAILLFFESVNEQAETQFGSAIGHLFADHIRPFKGHSACKQPPRSETSSEITLQDQCVRTWKWYPSWQELRTHYIYEVGFLASTTMSIGALIFYVAGIMALPQIYNNLSKPVILGLYNFTYLLGGALFIVAGFLYMLETQVNWYTPSWRKLGWHIAVWNFIGGVGWTIAASLTYCDSDMCEFQSQLSLTWASAAFAFGSALQWYESLEKYVVIIEG